MDGLRGPSRCGTDCLLFFLGTPKIGDDADAARVYLHHGRIFIGVGHVLRDVLEHQLLGLGFHVRAYEAMVQLLAVQTPQARQSIPSQVQVWSAIQVQFVLQHLVYSICRSPILWHLKFRDLLPAGVPRRVGCDVRSSASGMHMLLHSLLHMEALELLNDRIGVDLCRI